MINIWKYLRIKPTKKNTKDKPDYSVFPGVSHSGPFNLIEVKGALKVIICSTTCGTKSQNNKQWHYE